MPTIFGFPNFFSGMLKLILIALSSFLYRALTWFESIEERRLLSSTGGVPKNEVPHARVLETVDPDFLPRADQRDGTLEFHEAPKVKFIYPSYFEFPWSVTSGMVFRRSALSLIMPDEPSDLPICTDGYAFVICQYFTGSLALKSVLGAYRQHGINNFVNNPIMGTNLPSSPRAIRRHHQKVVRVMLQHLLDHHDRFATLFSDESVRKLLRILFRTCLQYGDPMRDARLRERLGIRRISKID